MKILETIPIQKIKTGANELLIIAFHRATQFLLRNASFASVS